jgi:hypothetical protein
MALTVGLLILSFIAQARSLADFVPGPRVPPTEADIARVIANNRGGLTACYERARSQDDTVVGGTIAVTLSIGRSGRVRSITIVTATPSLRAVDPCFQAVIFRWAFPASPRRYQTQFPMAFESECAMTIYSTPWAEVWIDGKNTGHHTPFVDDHAACGEHTLTLKRPDRAIEETETVTFLAGKRFERRYTLAKGN